MGSMKTPGKTFRFSSPLEISRNKLWGRHLKVPKRVAEAMIRGSSKRVWCALNGAPEHQCALIPFGNGVHIITVNASLQKKHKLKPGDPVHVTVWRDNTKYGLPMPEEFRELLRQDKEGNRFFHALTAGKQRTLLYIIGKGKKSNEKIERAIIIVRHLRENGGKINYRQLGEEMKKRRN